MTTTAFISGLLKNVHGLLNATIGEIKEEQLHWKPQGKALPIAAHYAHVVFIEDLYINAILKQGKPLIQTDFAETLGLSENPPLPGASGFVDYSGWANRVSMDLATFRAYAQAVFSAAENYVDSLDDQKLFQEIDNPLGGKTTPAYFLGILLIHAPAHTGEISCVKGLQDLVGYPI